MCIKTGLLVICVAVFILITGSLYVVSLAVRSQSDIATAEAGRYHSVKLADLLRQTSDDLTRMARLYVVTGEKRYKAYFDRILAIRDGTASRPVDYDNIYWDFVVAWGKPPRPDGAAVPMEQLMRDAHFTDDELALLREAKDRSDSLVALESQAMHAVEGRFLDERKQFAIVGPPNMDLARRLLHGQEYHRAKAEIMAPIQDFFTRVESRTRADVMHQRRRGERLLLVATVGLGAAVALTLVSFVVVARYPIAAAPRGTTPPSGDTPVTGQPRRALGPVIWTAWPLFAAAIVACLLVLALSWWTSQDVKDRGRQETREALEAVHRTTVRAVLDWLAGIEREASAWARSPVVRALLTAPPTRGPGVNTPELLSLLRSTGSLAGYLVIDSAGRVLASDDVGSRGQTLGHAFTERLIADLHRSPNRSTVALPGRSTVGLTERGRNEAGDDVEFRGEVLSAAGVPDQSGTIAGVLVLRFDPQLDLGRILRQGRFGESGATYAFTRSGRILVDGSSHDPRRGAPVPGIAPATWSADAGDRARGQAPPRPLTAMAEAALAGRSGVNMDGYPDDRGVPVIGAWTWIERFGLGVATEVQVQEAYGVLLDYLRQAHVGTGLSVLLIVGLSGMFVWNRLAMAAAGRRLETAYDVIRGHMDRVEEELQAARDLQLSMVPRVFPAFPERSDLSLHATLEPAREVGGDFYDFYFIDDAHLFFCIGDVSDKGVPAALFMAVTKTLIKARSVEEPSTAKLMTYVNAQLAQDNPESMFVTLLAGRLDVTTGELVYTNAGHDPPYVRLADGSVQRLAQRHGPMAGVAADAVYGESRHRLDPGDLFVVCTDGVTEARDAAGQLFSEERVAELVRVDGQLSTSALVHRLLAAVEAFERGAERADDITVLALRLLPVVREDAARAETVVLRNQRSEMDQLDQALDRFGRQAAVPPAAMSEIRVVCDEVVSNIIAYAYPRGGDHEIEVRLELTGRRLVITVSEDGDPFDPTAVAPPDTTLPLEQREPGGLGIHLVKNLVDGMTYARRGDRNVMTLVKEIGERSTASPLPHGTP